MSTKNNKVNQLSGVVASPGFARGEALVYTPTNLGFEPTQVADPEGEIVRLAQGARFAFEELEVLKQKVRSQLGDESAHIFRSQQTIVEDDSLLDEVREIIREKHCLAETGVLEVFGTYKALFEEIQEGDYNRERIADLEDVQNRLVRVLLGRPEESLAFLDRQVIVVAQELFPSDTATMDKTRVQGLITEKGGITSHVAIIARNLGVPAAVGVSDATTTLESGDQIYLDCTQSSQAQIYGNPTTEIVGQLEIHQKEFQQRQEFLEHQKGKEPVTLDGHRMKLSANIGSVEDIPKALADGAQSVGLFRSEFLFMAQKTLPGEEAQFRAYKTAVESFPEGFVILRTLDIGADKKVDALPLAHEENPFLGYRGIRISLDRTELFSTQLRAALRASAFGTLKIMFPMICGPDEVRVILDHLDRIKKDLTAEGHKFDDHLEIGVMLEVPSAIFMAPEIVQLVDFVSIGTNDLTQYLLAADRMNEQIQAYYQPFHPGVFRAIHQVVQAAHQADKWVGICGELGGMSLALPALVGLGVDELSMNSQSLGEAVYTTRSVHFTQVRELADRVLKESHSEGVKKVLIEFENQLQST